LDIEKFVDMACKLTDKSKNVFGAAYGDPVTVLPWETWFSEDGRTARLTNPTAVQAEQVMAQGIEDGCAPSPSVMDPWEQGNDFFTQKKLAMVVTDFQGLKQIEKAGIDYGVTAPPTAPGVEPFLQTWTDGVGVFDGSENPQDAMKYIEFLATTGQRLRVKLTGDVPLSSKVAKEANWDRGIPGREDALQVLPHARPAVFIPNRWDTVGPMFDAFGAIVSGEKSAEEAMADAQPQVQQNVDKAWDTWEKSG
jgi:ABC-type glycerol-3-phosphate transport system substrate-binding protein